MFNPIQNSTKQSLRLVSRIYQKGDYLQVLDSCYAVGSTQIKICQQILITQDSDSVRTVTMSYLPEFYEVTMRTKLPNPVQVYTDNSFSVQHRQVYSYSNAKSLNLTQSENNNRLTANGLNGFATIDGTLFRN